jgi:hypothetical protein
MMLTGNKLRSLFKGNALRVVSENVQLMRYYKSLRFVYTNRTKIECLKRFILFQLRSKQNNNYR